VARSASRYPAWTVSSKVKSRLMRVGSGTNALVALLKHPRTYRATCENVCSETLVPGPRGAPGTRAVGRRSTFDGGFLSALGCSQEVDFSIADGPGRRAAAQRQRFVDTTSPSGPPSASRTTAALGG